MHNEPTKVGLRIDVDTYRGTRKGVPELLKILSRQKVKASFFFTVGPDNMGRHLWRLLRPAFLRKMLRSNASSLYGYDILLKGTLWPGPNIGVKLGYLMAQSQQEGHEIGLHAWDHHKWQTKIETMPPTELRQEMTKGYRFLSDLLGEGAVTCSAVAGWRCNEDTLSEKEAFSFKYNSDCRGQSIFIPQGLSTPQIPVTLPTYDEVIGQGGITDSNYNQLILDNIKPGRLNVYTIHAEAEGIVCARQFEQLIVLAKERNIFFVPLSELLPDSLDDLPNDTITNIETEGREGWLSHQTSSI